MACMCGVAGAVLVCLLWLCGAAQDHRTLVIITDNEPDDIMALHLVAANFDPPDIDCIGTTGMDAGAKRDRVRGLMSALAMGQVPVLQGTGGVAADYPDIASLQAAKTFAESDGNAPHTSTDFQVRLVATLQACDAVEVVALAPPIDLADVLVRHSALRSSVRMVHAMGGWVVKDDVRRSTFNWNMVPMAQRHLLQSLFQMDDVPITIYSSHVINPMFGDGSVNPQTCPDVMDEIERQTPMVPSLGDFWRRASELWDRHLIAKVPRLAERIGAFAGNQFTPSDPSVIVAMVNDAFVEEAIGVRVAIDFDDMDARSGYRIVCDPVVNSRHVLVTKMSPSQFTRTVVASLRRLPDRIQNRMAPPN